MAKPPKAVREAAKRAEDLHRETYGDVTPGNQEEPTPQGGKSSEEPKETNTDNQEHAETANNPQEPAPEGEQRATEEPTPAPDEDDVETWKQRYRSLQGKYNAEVKNVDLPALYDQIRSQNSEIARLQRAVDEAEKARPDPVTKAQVQQNVVDDLESLVTDEEKEEYGEELTKFMVSIARRAADQATSGLTPKFEELKGEVTQSKALTAHQRVYAHLDKQMTDWREVNKSSEFHNWLAVRDPVTGLTRQEYLLKAFENGDAARVEGIFRQFTGGSAPTEQPATQETPQPQNGKLDLRELAGPRQTIPAGNPPARPEPVAAWTRQQISDFYRDVQKGVITGEEKQKLEKSLAQAMQEGRIE